MSVTAVNRTARWRDSGYWRSAAWLSGAVGALWVVLLPWSYWHQGAGEVLALSAAAASGLLPGLVALGITARSTDSQQVFAPLLLSMGLRLIPPLLICLALSQRGTGADFFSFICYLLLFYLVTLTVETCLSVRLVQLKR